MKIITDDKKLSEKLFKLNPVWKDIRPDISHQNIYQLLQDTFQERRLYGASKSAQSLWKYCLISDHAHRSQFEILIDHAQKNNDLMGGILCLAGSGQGFKGYRNRSWTSIKGNIHLSVFLKPDQPVDHFEVGFTILSAISVIQAINEINDLKKSATIRWINDIVIGNAKVGGVLTHTFSQGALVTGVVLGIGINVEATPNIESDIFVPETASIFDFISQLDANLMSILLHNLLKHLTVNYELLLKGRYAKLLDIYRKHSMLIGRIGCVYTDPINGNPKKLHEGKVTRIGKNLELFFENRLEPIKSGRIVIE